MASGMAPILALRTVGPGMARPRFVPFSPQSQTSRRLSLTTDSQTSSADVATAASSDGR